MTATFRGITESGDWTFGNGLQSYFTDVYSDKFNPIKADIETTLKTIFSECFFNQDIGIPWFDILNQKNPTALILTLKQAIYNIEGVTSVIELGYSTDSNRNVVITYAVDTLYTNQITGTVVI